MTTLPSIRLVLRTFSAGLVLAASVASAQPVGLFSGAPADAPAAAIPGHANRASARVGQLNPSVFAASQLSIELPDGRVLIADRERDERGPRGEMSWVGSFQDAPGTLLVLTRHQGAITGFFHHDDETYELQGSEAGVLLFQVDDAALPDEGEPVPVTSDAPDADALVNEEAAVAADALASGDPIVQDLLVVYTPASVATAGSVATLESKILSAISAANAAYVNSAINLRLNLVGMSQIAYTETGDMSTTLSRLRTVGDGHMDTVHGLRDSLGADLVALISNESNYCGIAYVMTSVSSSFASSAFSVTTQSCFSNQTLAHEIGHNQGNSHDRANGGSSAYAYSFGYRTCDNIAYTNGQSFRTVMGYSCSGTPRVNYFSNPQVFYNGAPMGVAYETNSSTAADNARSMRNTAATIAAFRSAPASTPPAAPTNLTGTATSFDRISLTWQDRSSDETGFTIERAVNGGSFSTRATLASNTTSFIDSGLSGSTTYHYRVRASNQAGASSWTNTASVTTPAAPVLPNSPSPATLTLSGSTAVVTWTNVSNEDSYRVTRETYNSRKRTWSATNYTVAANLTSFSQSLNSGTYRYSVRSVNAAGTSSPAIATCSGCGSDGSFTVGGGTTAKGRDKDRMPGKP